MKHLRLLVVAAALPLAAQAQELNYTFVEASYLSSDLDAGPFDIDGDGFGLKGSYAINESLFAFGAYSKRDYRFGVDARSWDLGVGMRWPLQRRVDLIADIAWVNYEVKLGNQTVDDDGFGIGVGLRGRVHDRVELQGAIRYVDLSRSDTVLALGGRYYFTDNVAVGFGFDIDDDNEGWSLGLRFEF